MRLKKQGELLHGKEKKDKRRIFVMKLDNATLLITGGTGSFGNTVLKHFLTSDVA